MHTSYAVSPCPCLTVMISLMPLTPCRSTSSAILKASRMGTLASMAASQALADDVRRDISIELACTWCRIAQMA